MSVWGFCIACKLYWRLRPYWTKTVHHNVLGSRRKLLPHKQLREKTSAHLTLHYFRSGILDIFECQGIHDVWCRDNVQPRVYDSGSLNKPQARIIDNVIMVLIDKTLKKNVLDVCVWMLTLTMPWSFSWLINPRIGHSDVSLKDTTVPFKVTRRSS